MGQAGTPAPNTPAGNGKNQDKGFWAGHEKCATTTQVQSGRGKDTPYHIIHKTKNKNRTSFQQGDDSNKTALRNSGDRVLRRVQAKEKKQEAAVSAGGITLQRRKGRKKERR